MDEKQALHILYEDRNCIVPEKTQDLLSEDIHGVCLPTLLREYLAEKGEDAEVYPVHRLDKPTGGAILYAKTKESASYLSSAVAHRELGKRYLAVIAGIPEAPAGRMRDCLYHDKWTNKVFVVKRERKGAKEAILEYRTVETADYDGMPLTLVEVNLMTGRTHQIRAQFASRRLPVYGDRRYGCKESLSGGKIALWSHFLSFTPRAGDEMRTVTSLPPREFPWSCFEKLSRS